MTCIAVIRPVTRVEYYRRLAGVSQGLLSERLGRVQTYISKIERGLREVDDDERRRIAEALGIDPRLLVEESGFPPLPVPAGKARTSCRVRKIRKERGWSQEKLAARTGIDARRIARIESGREEATLEEALVLAEAAGMRVEELFSRRERGPLKGKRNGDAAAALVGRRFGHLTVIDALANDEFTKGGRQSLCRCDCGNVCKVRNDHLKSGHTTSCGCQSGKRKARKRGKPGNPGDRTENVS